MIVISCQHETRHKHGKNKCGNQRYKCANCGATFVEESALGAMRVDTKTATMALSLMLEGMSVRSVQRLTGLCRDTLADLILVVGENCQRLLETTVKAVPVKQVGYAGLMVPVMEDKLLGQRWAEASYNMDSLLAYSAVCVTGLDTVPLAGDISEERLVRIYGDVASLAIKWNKPLSARLQPVKGKKAGDRTEYQDPYLFNTVIR